MKNSVLPFFMLALMVFLGGSPGNAEQIFAKLGTTFPSDHPMSESLAYFQRAVWKRLDGQMNIQIFPNSQLGTDHDILEGLRFGDIEMGVLSSESLTSCASLLNAISMPYIFRDEAHRFHVLDGPIGMQLLHSLEQSYLIGLGFLDASPKNLITKHGHLKNPQDFQGHTIGIISPQVDHDCGQDIPLQLFVQSLEVMNASAEILDLGSLYKALQADTILGTEIDPFSALALKMYETEARYFTIDDHTTTPNIILASKRWFDTLSPEIQQTLRQVSVATIRRHRELWSDRIQKAIVELEAEGVQFEKADRETFRHAVQPVYMSMYKQFGPEFEEIIQAILAVQ